MWQHIGAVRIGYILIRSFNGGDTWDGPFEISSGNGPWYYPHLEVSSDHLLVCVYSAFGGSDSQIWFAKSDNYGTSWERVLISEEATRNPSLLTIDGSKFFVFAQSGESAYRGLVYNYTVNQGATWNGWTLIDPTCGYADPSPGLGNDGQTIYVAYREAVMEQVSRQVHVVIKAVPGWYCPSDLGQTWDFVDNYYEGERVGTRSQIRYQTWWNYGGPLEWIWMQYEDGGANRPIYYDINVDESIKNIQNNPIGPVANFSGTPTLGTAPLEVSFTDSSTGDVESWAWSFGDGGSSTNQNPTHIYDEFDTYTVSLEVTGPGGSDTERSGMIILRVTAMPVEYDLTVEITGEGSVTLDPSGTTYDQGTPVQLTALPDGSEGVFHRMGVMI